MMFLIFALLPLASDKLRSHASTATAFTSNRLIDGFVRLVATGDDITGPVNLGNPHEIPVSELADRVIRLTGSRSRVVYRELPQDDPLQRCPDITLARTTLGWEPRIALDDGLLRTIAYFNRMLVEFFERNLGVK
jgi:UDP-glucuronate decarboxylase